MQAQQLVSHRRTHLATPGGLGRGLPSPAVAKHLRAARLWPRTPAPVVCLAHNGKALPEEEEPSTSAAATLSPAARRTYNRLAEGPQRIGAEWGEGFVQFRMGGEPRRLDVAALNEQLKAGGAIRMRYQLRPDEAYGTIFDFDTVVADTAAAYRRAWAALAAARGLPLPPLARLTAHGTAPERIIMQVLGWTDSMREARALAYELAEAYTAELEALGGEPLAGAREWLGALGAFGVPAALVSSLDRPTVRRALERMHLHDHFRVMVTAEDELESAAQRYLSAALALQRPPNMCVVFGATPEAVTAAHNCTMKAVAVPVNEYPAYKLRSADVTLARLSDLTVYNIRRLFANAGDEFMDYRKQRSDDKPTHRRRVASAML